MWRHWSLAALVAGIWLLSAYGQSMPHALGKDAPTTQFSFARADHMLQEILDPQQPHPVGSVQAQIVRTRILNILAEMGVPARVQTRMSCVGEARWNQINCATIDNIVADVLSGKGKSVVLMAHSDSVAAGPGAGDDGSGVAILLETIRAMRARTGGTGRPVVALFSDGEEAGLLGASAYVREEKDHIAAVVNVDVRGDSGASYLFQTSPQASGLLDLYAEGVSHYATSSVAGEIYKHLPNDTDLTPALDAGLPGVNFAFIGDVAAYHTPLDRRENLDARSVQEQGDNMLAMARALRIATTAQLKNHDSIYLDILGIFLPRLNIALALPASILALLMIILADVLTSRERRMVERPLLALAMPPLLVLGSIGMGFVLHGFAAWVSGSDNPSFAHPVWLRLSLAFGVWAVSLLTSRFSSATACWLWMAILALVCCLWLPGATPYFLFPSLVGASLLLVTVRYGRNFALFIAAIFSLVIWIGFAAVSETLMGFGLHELFTASAAFGLISVLPLMRKSRNMGLSVTISLAASILFASVAGLQPIYSPSSPQRLNLHYVEENQKAWWVADPVKHLPTRLRDAAHFSDGVIAVPAMGYVANAGNAIFPAPNAHVTRHGRDVIVDLNALGDGLNLQLPKFVHLRSLTIAGKNTPADGRVESINCFTPDCGRMQMTLHMQTSGAFEMTLRSLRRGLPPKGLMLLRARTAEAVPSQMGDLTVLVRKIMVPAG